MYERKQIKNSCLAKNRLSKEQRQAVKSSLVSWISNISKLGHESKRASLERSIDERAKNAEIKRNANYESDRVYSKGEVENAISEIKGLEAISITKKVKGKLREFKGFKALPKSVRDELIDDIWRGLNSHYSKEQRSRHVELLGAKTFVRVMQESGDSFDNASSEDIAAMERNIFKALREINEKGGTESIKAKLEAEFDTSKAGYWKKERDNAIKHFKAMGEVLEGAKKLRTLKMGAFLSATQTKNDTFELALTELSKIEHRSQFNVSGTRKHLKKLLEWYDVSNPIFKSEDGENGVSPLFDGNIRAELVRLTQDGGACR